MPWYLCLVLFMGAGVQTTAFPAAASAPGHIIIGGLFPIHAGVRHVSPPQADQHSVCVDLNENRITQALAMIQAVEEANRSPTLTKLGITLGYRVHDCCSDVSTALQASLDFTNGVSFGGSGGSGGAVNGSGSGGSCQANSNSSERIQPVMAVVGASSSELSISVARLLTLYVTPQISYSSTATILSDKVRFPAFMRTVPNDNYQTCAMVKLLSDNKWNWVGVITTDGDYGRSAVDSFASQAAQNGICLAFKEVLPDSVTNPNVNSSIHRAVQTIRNNMRAKVIVSFAKPVYMQRLFEELLRGPAEDRVWIASDGWSNAGNEMEHLDFASLGTVIGFFFKSGNISSFRQYLKQMNTRSDIQDLPFMQKYYQSVHPVNVTSVLLKNIHLPAVFSIQMAIGAISQAVAQLCSKGEDCKTPGAVKPWQLLRALKNTTFEKEGKQYRFDEYGDVNLGYDISIWSTTGGTIRSLNVVAEYHPQNNSITPISPEMEWQLSVLKSVVSKCSNSCEAGEVKKTVEGQHTCCYECIACPENHYSNHTDMDQCLSCDTTKEWAPARSEACQLKTMELLDWEDGFAIVLLALAGLGIIMALVIAVLFLWQRNTPVVRAAGGPLCQVILFSLTGSFVSVVFFVGQPSNLKCKVRQVLFGLSFTLCVSCILVKSLKILLAFNFNPSVHRALRRLYKPYAIVMACMGLQVLVCILWLVLRSPRPRQSPGPTTVLAECDEGSYEAFGTMLAYIAFLALVCFGFAFKGRKLPESYNEAKFITFGMLIYLISWVIFIPVYVTTSGKYLPAVEMVVILMSNYGILCCHFLPKCYIIVFKKEHNTKDAFLKNVYEYSQRSSGSVSMGSTYLDSEEKRNSEVFAIGQVSIDLPSKVVNNNTKGTVDLETPISEFIKEQMPSTVNLASPVFMTTKEQKLNNVNFESPISEVTKKPMTSHVNLENPAIESTKMPESKCLKRTFSV
ncbi:hypothetical protein ACEWY4_020362 [Coilia grayii]|uniref:G-protein coupled receptor family C group 6 member A n=1 Tax=Coilia grayii TaxID=363190 RepID=A0ABD1JCF5_9TELE